MKPQRALIAERALAQHCAELLRPAPPTAELVARLDAAGAALAGALASALAPLLGFDAPKVEPEPASECASDALAQQVAAYAAFSLLRAGKERVPLLAAFDGEAVLRLVDRAFGGKGTAPNPLPETLPLSAELMIARLEGLAMTALDRVWQLGGPGSMELAGRNAKLDQLGPFPPAIPLAVQRFTVTESGGARWAITLALPLAAIGELLGEGARSAGTGQQPRAEANPADEPYGALQFAVHAVLVDMAMPVSAVSALVPGQILPVSVARNVPLRIGNRTFAHGSIGTLDERVAVQITQAF